MKRLLGVTWLALIVGLSVSPAQAQNRFRAVSGGFGTAVHAVLWVGYEKKIFQKYGLDLEYFAIENGTVSMQTLLANETQAAFTTGALAVTANLQGGDAGLHVEDLLGLFVGQKNHWRSFFLFGCGYAALAS